MTSRGIDDDLNFRRGKEAIEKAGPAALMSRSGTKGLWNRTS